MDAQTATKEVKSVRRPPAAGMGRKKGTPNKVTGQVKEMILTALSDAGGAKYLLAQSAANPVAFMSLVGKVLPLQIAGEGKDGAINIIVKRFDD